MPKSRMEMVQKMVTEAVRAFSLSVNALLIFGLRRVLHGWQRSRLACETLSRVLTRLQTGSSTGYSGSCLGGWALSWSLCAVLGDGTCFSKADLRVSAENLLFVSFFRLLLSASKTESLRKLQKLSRGTWGRSPGAR